MNFPVVQTPVGRRILPQQGGVLEHAASVVIAVVIAPQSLAEVPQTPPTHQIASSGVDRGAGVADVAPLPDAGFRPGGGQELHRAVGIGDGNPIDPAHAALHQVDRGEHLPGDARGGGRLPVVAQQILGGFRSLNAPGRQRGGPRRAMHGEKLPSGAQMPVQHRMPALRQLPPHLVRQAGAMGKHPVDHLLLMAQGRQLLLRRGGVAQRLLHPGQQLRQGGGVWGHQRVMAAIGGAGQGGFAGERHRGLGRAAGDGAAGGVGPGPITGGKAEHRTAAHQQGGQAESEQGRTSGSHQGRGSPGWGSRPSSDQAPSPPKRWRSSASRPPLCWPSSCSAAHSVASTTSVGRASASTSRR